MDLFGINSCAPATVTSQRETVAGAGEARKNEFHRLCERKREDEEKKTDSVNGAATVPEHDRCRVEPELLNLQQGGPI
jgi:hypothetical protein